jgi:hypothetical protein
MEFPVTFVYCCKASSLIHKTGKHCQQSAVPIGLKPQVFVDKVKDGCLLELLCVCISHNLNAVFSMYVTNIVGLPFAGSKNGCKIHPVKNCVSLKKTPSFISSTTFPILHADIADGIVTAFNHLVLMSWQSSSLISSLVSKSKISENAS